MSQKEDFNKELPNMQALQASEVKTPNMPSQYAAQEADETYAIAIKYQNQLQAGVPVNFL